MRGAAARVLKAASQLLRPIHAAAFLGGATIVQTFSALPPRMLDLAIAVLAIGLCARRTRWRLVGAMLLGIAWTAFRADIALQSRLPHDLENEDLLVVGTVHDLPRIREDGVHFEFAIEHATHDATEIPLRGLIRLGWYDTTQELQPCERWQLRVKLKRPRGTINPGGFDFERYALERGIVATGSVRESADDEAIGRANVCVDALRADITSKISEALGPGDSASLLRAIGFGDEHAMDEKQWAIARTTGIPHLIAISGLHIALFASFGIGLMRAVWKIAPRLTLRWPAPLLEAVASLLVAVTYALIAGFGLPTRRALVMIGALLLANLSRRARSPVHGLSLAVIVLLVADPLCVLSAGFWLSFIGVAWLTFCLRAFDSPRHGLRQMFRSQGVASLGLLPAGVWFFGQSSLIGPVANLVAVPVVCFFVLPVGVVAALIASIWPTLGFPMLVIVGSALDVLWYVLQRLAELPGVLWFFPEPTILALALAMLGAFWLLQPRGVPARALGALLLLPLLWPQRVDLDDGEFEAFMLDVGQGLAMIVRTRDHTLVYDTGPRYPSGFDLGGAAVVPALRALGIGKLDRLIISHGDSDHAGGAESVTAAFGGAAIESGEPERLPMPARQCRAGEAWNWNGVSFRIVNPQSLDAHGNDRCCVLEVRSGDSEFLLTGDITAAMEDAVAAQLQPVAPHLVLQSPHHGSKTSSSESFLDALRPAYTIISAGYLNRFHHPHPDVVARYRARGTASDITSESGFVRMRFGPTGAPTVIERGRIDRHPYWRE